MHISLFDLFSIGIGPSSSHTVGPMKAAATFVKKLNVEKITRIKIELYGSLALTGVGHGTDKAILVGLLNEEPETVDPLSIIPRYQQIVEQKQINLAKQKYIPFSLETDLIFNQDKVLPHHTNGMRFIAYNEKKIVLTEIYYSIGGGFIVNDKEYGQPNDTIVHPPYPFDTAAEILHHCEKHSMTIAHMMMENEKIWREENEIKKSILHIADIMMECIEKGCRTPGTLPGGLNVTRRAPQLFQKLNADPTNKTKAENVLNWINLFAMAVNEENAAGSRIVTAPTNGAAGIIPAVLAYYKQFCDNPTDDGVINYLLTAGAIAILYKKGASISGAEVGCQGEVGVASSMAAGALTAVLGGSIWQVENAAEIAMEHHLGMTCDPINGLVQIPCIERNAMGSVKAVNAARLALLETGKHIVSLDKVIATMRETGKNMMTIYKETSLGGLAVNVPEC